jgi:Xaa-Pro aminopeptidase
METNFLSYEKYLARFHEIQKFVIPITRQLGQSVKPGMNEREIADVYEKLFADVGLVDNWYPILVNAGKNSGKAISRRVHLPEADAVIRDNDIVILDCTPIDKTVWGNWSETFVIGADPFYQALVDDCLQIVGKTAVFARTSAKTVGDVLDYCMGLAEELKMTSLDSRHDVGHSIFQVPEGQTVEKTPLSDRLFLNDDYRSSPLSGIISLEPHFGRIDSRDGQLYGAKQQEIIIYPL